MEYYKGTYINSFNDCVDVIRVNTDNELASTVENFLYDALYEAQDNAYESFIDELSEAQIKLAKLLVNKIPPDIVQEALNIASCGYGYSKSTVYNSKYNQHSLLDLKSFLWNWGAIVSKL